MVTISFGPQLVNNGALFQSDSLFWCHIRDYCIGGCIITLVYIRFYKGLNMVTI